MGLTIALGAVVRKP